MVTRVLVVDDSGFFRRRIVDILESDPDIKVVGTASDGQEAVDQVKALKPDVVTMDVEMPVMDGITAVRHIMSSNPVPILMFSAFTREGVQATLDALEAGAVDFLPKKFDGLSNNDGKAKNLLTQRIHEVACKGATLRSSVAARSTVRPSARTFSTPGKRNHYQMVVIASSTGGPAALPKVLAGLPVNFPCPILIVQHMPANFTPGFAVRLNQQCALNVKEAENGDQPKAGHVYLAPGGKQMKLRMHGGAVAIEIGEGDPKLSYRPSADITFSSVNSICGGRTLGVVLTGMGADGCKGAGLLKKNGATIWTQDEASCVIYGMPMAVASAGFSDQELSLNDIGPTLIHEIAS